MEIKKLAKHLIVYAARLRASDIYLLPIKDKYQVTMRIFNRKMNVMNLELELASKLILYFKYQADMDVGEKRKAQLGSCTFQVDDNNIRLRLSTVSNYLQLESLVIRLLQQKLKLNPYYGNISITELMRIVQNKGLHLFCGPVGSGKTTLMYYLARKIGNNKQIITIEDPVEIEEINFLQLQIQNKIDLTYETLIKLCLRHRPDILVVGEIRDVKTAKNTIRAALTGHTVFATIHASDAIGVTRRLEELEVSRIDIKQTIKSIIYQRFLPMYCPLCQDDCHPYCERYHRNYLGFYEVTVDYMEGKSWNEVLQKAYLTGIISKKTYFQEKRI